MLLSEAIGREGSGEYLPMPSVEARLEARDDLAALAGVAGGGEGRVVGELLVCGPTLFREYLHHTHHLLLIQQHLRPRHRVAKL